MLILVGSGVIVFEAIRHLVLGSQVENLGFGIVVISIGARREPGRLGRAAPPRASSPAHPRWTPTRRTCAPTRSRRSASSPGWCWCRSPAPTGSTRPSRWPLAAAIAVQGFRIVTRLLARARRRGAAGGRDRGDPRRPSSSSVPAVSWATTSSAPAARARAATSTCTSSSATGRRSRTRTPPRTSCRTRSARRLDGADVLIHLEPADRVVPGTEIVALAPPSPSRPAQIDRRARADRDRDAGVAPVALGEQDRRREQAQERR